MTGFWLVSFVVLWLLMLGEGVAILVLARELESLRSSLGASAQHSRSPPPPVADAVISER